MEEATCHTLQPPQKFAVPPPALQFIDVPVTLDDNLQLPLLFNNKIVDSSSSKSSQISNQIVESNDRVLSDLCFKTWTKKGFTKHRNPYLNKKKSIKLINQL